MSYPFDGDMIFEDLQNFGKIRNKFLYPLLAITAVATLINQIAFLKPYTEIVQGVYFILVALVLGVSFGLTYTINTKTISSAYDKKAGFEAALYNLLCEIEKNSQMPSDVKKQIYIKYLEEIMYRPGRHQHLASLPTETKANLIKTLEGLQKTVAEKILKRIGTNGTIDSASLGSDTQYCQNIEAMIREIQKEAVTDN